MNVFVIASRELRSTFTTAVGWLVLCGWLFLTGLFWVLMVQNYVLQGQEMSFDPYASSRMNLTDWLLVPFFGNCAVILIMVAPALSMRVFAEEIKQRTLELLLTSPVSTFEIVFGKFLGLLGFVVVLLASTLQFPLGLLVWATPDPGAVAGGYASLLLLASGLVAMGMLMSSLTSNQIVAAVLTFACALGLLVLQWGSTDPNDWYSQLSIMGHTTDLLRGAVRLSDVVYYVAFTAFFLFATVQRMESFRWR